MGAPSMGAIARIDGSGPAASCDDGKRGPGEDDVKTKRASAGAKATARAKKMGGETKAAAKKSPTAKKSSTARKKSAAAEKSASMTKFGPRTDLGAPIEGFFARQPPHLRPILDELRAMVEKAIPGAESSLKWGMPFFLVGGEMVCALAAHKSHVNLILAGPPGTFADPDGLLEGEGKTGRHLKVTRLEDLPRKAVAGWLRTAARRALGQ
jgi:hypothetical protein